ncbi:MAG: hypothetical protein KC549_17080, partial [Myxococcales bacterium]|nr:hypothetical protein [Myxococcales bacterium]
MPARRIAACLALTTQACTSTHQIRATDLPAEGIAWPNGEDGRPVDAARVEDEIVAFSRKAQALPTLTGEAVSVGGDFQGVLLAPG